MEVDILDFMEVDILDFMEVDILDFMEVDPQPFAEILHSELIVSGPDHLLHLSQLLLVTILDNKQ